MEALICEQCEKPAANWAYHSRSGEIKFRLCDDHYHNEPPKVSLGETTGTISEQALRLMIEGVLRYYATTPHAQTYYDEATNAMLGTLFAPSKSAVIEQYMKERAKI